MAGREPEDGTSPLCIRLFGPIDVRLNGAPLPRLHSRKGLWLLALLTLRHPSAVERDWLAGLLWPDSDETQALAGLRNTLADLRRALGCQAARLGSPTTQTLSLDLTDADVDVLRFDAAVASGDTPSLEQAAALYRGPLLEGCVEEWVLPEREEREQAYLGALERLATEALGRTERAAAEGYLRRVAAVDPTRESAQRVLMRVLSESGNYAAATLAYRELRLHLHRELNAQPDAETTALYEQIRADARSRALAPPVPSPPVSSPPPSPVPSPLPGEATLTFLFTDIEGSTKRWEAQAEAMREALDRHDAILRAAIEANDGRLFKSMGDGVCAAFATAPDAVAAAVASQRTLWTEDWGAVAPLRVRMALYTGIAEERGGDYVGPPLNRVARLLGAGHGGQILLSSATQELARDRLPEGVSLRDLGLHRLPDVPHPEQLFQLVHANLPETFPPLKTLGAVPNNLPRQLTSFVGREAEIAEVKRLLSTTCLLTLTGTGGCGKTRLALETARQMLAEYPDGVWVGELASLADGALVPQAVASTLGVREEPGRRITDVLSELLRSKSVLLILDNCEHLVGACAKLTEALLQGCPHLQILATSRERLGIAGELTYRVPSLSMPDAHRLPPAGADLAVILSQYDAARLFIDRATLSESRFAITEHNASVVAQLCHRLDGIPLAIELAASRVRLLSVEQIAARLDDRFRLLTGGSRSALARQQTLRATIDWSYDLLSDSERALLRRLSVFAGGWTLEAAEAVCSDDGGGGWGDEVVKTGPLSRPPHLLSTAEILDLLSRLVDKSLVVVEEPQAEVRYQLLETLREYAGQQLVEIGEAEAARTAHTRYYLDLAEAVEPKLISPEQAIWFEQLQGEHDNLRAALAWAVECDAAEVTLRLAGALWRFWMTRGYYGEGRGWLERALAAAGGAAAALRAKASTGAGSMAWCLGDYVQATAFHQEALAAYREARDRSGMAFALHCLGTVASDQGENEQALVFYEQGLDLYRELGDRWGIAAATMGHGVVAVRQGDFERAQRYFEESLTLYRELGDPLWLAYALHNLGVVAQGLADYTQAAALHRESLTLMHEVGEKWGAAYCLVGLAAALGEQGSPERATRLCGAAAALREALGAPLPPTYRAEYEGCLAAARAGLDEEAFAAAWAEGRALTLEQALAYASKEAEPA